MSKAPRLLCSVSECTYFAQRGGVCVRHGGKQVNKTCSHKGCSNFVQNGGVCIRHGAIFAPKKCSHDGCTNNVVRGGVCIRHGAHKTPSQSLPSRNADEWIREYKGQLEEARLRSRVKSELEAQNAKRYAIESQSKVQKLEAEIANRCARASLIQELEARLLAEERRRACIRELEGEIVSRLARREEALVRLIRESLIRQSHLRDARDTLIRHSLLRNANETLALGNAMAQNRAAPAVVRQPFVQGDEVLDIASTFPPVTPKEYSGVCVRHGAKDKRCSHEGCTNKVRQGGVCIQHGERQLEDDCCSAWYYYTLKK